MSKPNPIPIKLKEARKRGINMTQKELGIRMADGLKVPSNYLFCDSEE